MSRAVKPGAIDWDVFFRKDDSSLQALLRKSPSLLEMILFIPLCLRLEGFAPGVPVADISAILLSIMAFGRKPKVGWQPAFGYRMLLFAIPAWMAIAGVYNDQLPFTRMGHIVAWALVIAASTSGRLNMRALVGSIGVSQVIATGYGIITLPQSTYPGRMIGMFGDPNTAGLHLLALGLVYAGIAQRNRKYFIVLAISMLGIFLTFSRTTWLGLGLALAWVFIPKNFNVWLKATLLFGVYKAVIGYANDVKNEGSFSDRAGSDHLRSLIVPLEEKLVAENPFVGHGPGTLTIKLGENEFFFHSSYLLLRAEGGWIMFYLMLTLVVLTIVKVSHPLSTLPNRYLEAAPIAILVCAANLGNVFLSYPACLALAACTWWAHAPGADEEQLAKLEAPVEEDLRASQNKLVNYLAGHENVMAKYDKLEKLEEEASKA